MCLTDTLIKGFGMLKAWLAIPFWQRVLGGFVLGALIGVVASDFAVAMQPLGQLFINAIQMLVVPLVFCAIVSSITSLQAQSNMRRLAFKTVGLFIFTAWVASLIGLSIGTLIDMSPATQLSMTDVVER